MLARASDVDAGRDSQTRRPKRNVRRRLAAIPVLLLVAVLALWAGSYWITVKADWFSSDRRTEVAVSWEDGFFGDCYLHVDSPLEQMAGAGLTITFEHSLPPGRSEGTVGRNTSLFQHRLGPLVYSTLGFPGYSSHFVECPFWTLALLLSVQPLISVLTWNARRRRMATNHCVECGYDLRASEDTCPECGTPLGIDADKG